MQAIIIILLWASVLGAGLAWVALSLALPAVMKGSRWRALMALPFVAGPAGVTIYLVLQGVLAILTRLRPGRFDLFEITCMLVVAMAILSGLALAVVRPGAMDRLSHRILLRLAVGLVAPAMLAALTGVGIFYYLGASLSGWNLAWVLILDGVFVAGAIGLLRARWWRYPAAAAAAGPVDVPTEAPVLGPSGASPPVPVVATFAEPVAGPAGLPLKLYARLMGVASLCVLVHFGALWTGNRWVTGYFSAQRAETLAAWQAQSKTTRVQNKV